METELEISVFKKKGLTQKQIVRNPGISRNTVNKDIEHQGVTRPDRSETHRKSLHRRQGQVMLFGKVVVMSQPAPYNSIAYIVAPIYVLWS